MYARTLPLCLALSLFGCSGEDSTKDTDTGDTDAGTDTDTDSGTDTGTDAGTDTGTDADTGTDSGGSVDAYVSFPGGHSLWYSDAYSYDSRTWTFEMWVKPTESGTEVRLLEWLNGGAVDGRTSRAYWVIDLDASGKIQLESSAAGIAFDQYVSLVVSSTTAVPTGTWSHVAVVVDGTLQEVRFYLDGADAGSSNLDNIQWWTVPVSTSHQLGIGGRGAVIFTGAMDDVRLWSVARTATEIATNRSVTFTTGTAPTGLVDQFDFDASFDSLMGNVAGEALNVTRVE